MTTGRATVARLSLCIAIAAAVAGCSYERPAAVNPMIESPIQNTCQSGDLLPNFPKCE